MDKKYFSNPGDIENNFFKVPGDIESVSKGDTIPTDSVERSFFKVPGDIESVSKGDTKSTDSVEDYLVSIVSGKKYDYESELGTLIGAGKTIVDFNRLQEMVSLGFNIVSAKYINDKMIEIEFQEFKKDNVKGMVR